MGLVVGAVIFAIVLLTAAGPIGDKLQEASRQADPFPGYTYTATNPKTGEKFGLRDGKWESIPAESIPADIDKRYAIYAKTKYRAELWPQALYFLGGLLGAVAVGSFLAIFFYKDKSAVSQQ
jgi:hypothetical protein